jgi:hypothetical protein
LSNFAVLFLDVLIVNMTAYFTGGPGCRFALLSYDLARYFFVGKVQIKVYKVVPHQAKYVLWYLFPGMSCDVASVFNPDATCTSDNCVHIDFS